MDYGVWLSFNNQTEGFKLPINPSSIEVGEGNKGSTYDIEKLGEINVIKNPSLTTYSFSGLFPATKYPFVTEILMEPVSRDEKKQNYYVYYLKKWMESKRPIRFLLRSNHYVINTAASIESFSWKEVAGSNGDIQYSLKLKEYKFYAARKVKFIEGVSKSAVLIKDAPARSNDKQAPKTYTLVAGDTLWKVAQTQLGKGARWSEILQLNNISDAELKRLQIGKVLKLP